VAEVPLLTMAGVARSFGRVRAVEDASLAILRGATLALVGDSGSGKSTLGRLAVGLLRPDAGTILFDGVPLDGRSPPAATRRRIAMVFQDPADSLDPRWTVGASIAEPILAFRLREGRAAIANRVMELLASVGMPLDVAGRLPRAFDRGQLLRVAIARAVAGEPDFLVCDEPTGLLDASLQAQVLNLLRDLQARLGLTMLFISNDLGAARHMADLVAVMLRGRLVEFGVADEVLPRPLHPYTRQLVEAAFDLAGAAANGGAPVDLPPPLAETGCAFHSRCGLATQRCRVEAPPLLQAGTVAVACHAVPGDPAE
jgi:peptide/nickel transport system ATP-binding protein